MSSPVPPSHVLPSLVPDAILAPNGALVARAEPDAKATARVVDRLASIGTDDGDDLVFDPATGRLTIRAKGALASPDAVSAVQMARTGFFADRWVAGKGGVPVARPAAALVGRGLARRATAALDLTAAVRDIAGAARAYAEVREQETTRRAAIAAHERVELARIAAQRDIVLTALDRAFDERAASFRQLFDALDRALDGGDPAQVGAVTATITHLAATNPFVALRDVASIQAAAADPSHTWDL